MSMGNASSGSLWKGCMLLLRRLADATPFGLIKACLHEASRRRQKPRAALPRESGPHEQHGRPEMEISPSPDRQCISKDTEARGKLHVDWRTSCAWSASFLIKQQQQHAAVCEALLLFEFRGFATQQTAVALE